jgi:hypothetical protein
MTTLLAGQIVARFQNKAGADRVLYHGSKRIPLDKIPPVDGGSDFDIWGKGIYLAFDPDVAARYGTVRPLILSGKAKLAPDYLWVEALKEAHLDEHLEMPKDRKWAREKLRADGWDGLQSRQYLLVWNEGLIRLP